MKILYLSFFNPLDRTSGASISCYTILKQLKEKGHEVATVSSTVFDRPEFPKAVEFLKKYKAQTLKNQKKQYKDQIPFCKIVQDGIVHFVAPSHSQNRRLVYSFEESAWWNLARVIIAKFKPDVVYGYGGQIAEQVAFRYLYDKKIPYIFYLANANYKGKECFEYCSSIVTDTQATSDHYKESLGIQVNPIGKFIDPYFQQESWPRDCITMVNPAPEKGAAIFLKILQKTIEKYPDAKFLVVESRGKIVDTIQKLKLKIPKKNIEIWPLQDEMSKVWARTKVLIHPSLWHESGSRTCMEALSAGVPVLATKSGGTKEMLNGSGHLFDFPDNYEVGKYFFEPSDDSISEWMDVLIPLLSDPKKYKEESKKARESWDNHPVCNRLDRLEKVMQSVVKKPNLIKQLKEAVK